VVKLVRGLGWGREVAVNLAGGLHRRRERESSAGGVTALYNPPVVLIDHSTNVRHKTTPLAIVHEHRKTFDERQILDLNGSPLRRT
jgi:hypothetical protein